MRTLPILFRVHRGEVSAYFPTLAWDPYGLQITCWDRVSGHGGASPFCLSEGRPAQPEEYAADLKHLQERYADTSDGEGFNLRVYRRRPTRGRIAERIW